MCIIVRLGLIAKVLAHISFLIFLPLMCNYAVALESCVLENDMQISLKSFHGKYVAAEKKDGKLVANRSWMRPWEKFAVITHDTGEISLKSFHGKYIAAEKKDGKLIANRKNLRSWEKFEVVAHDTGEISLKSFHGKYVAAEKKDGKLVANRSWVRPWEKFILVNHVGDESIICEEVLTQAEADERIKSDEVIEILENTIPIDSSDDDMSDDSIDAIAGLMFLSGGCWLADTVLWIMPPIFFGASKVAAVGVAEECFSLSSELAIAGTGTVVASKITKSYQDRDGHAHASTKSVYPNHYKVYPVYDIDVKCNIATNFLEHEVPAIACEYGKYLLQIAYTEANIFKAYLTTADSYKELNAAELKDMFHNDWYEWFLDDADDLDRYLNGIDSPFNSDKAQWLSTTSIFNQPLIRPLLIDDINNGNQDKNKYFINIPFNSDMDESRIEAELKDSCKNLQKRLFGGVYDNCVRKFIRSSAVYKEILSELDLTYDNLHNIGIPSDRYSQGKKSKLLFKKDDKLSTAYHKAYHQNYNNWEMVNTVYIQTLASIIASRYRTNVLAQYEDKISIDLANKFNNSLKQLIEYINTIEFYGALKDLGYSQLPSNTITLPAVEYDKVLNFCNLNALCSQHIEMESFYKAAIEGAASAYSASLYLQPILQPVIQGVEKIFTLANAFKSWVDESARAYGNSDESLYKRYDEGDTHISFLKTGVEIFQGTSPALAALVYETGGVRIEVPLYAEQQIYSVHADGAMEEMTIIEDFLPLLPFDRLQRMRAMASKEDIKDIIGLFSPLVEDVKRAVQGADPVVEEYIDNPVDAVADAVPDPDTRWIANYDSDEERLILKNKQLHSTLYWSPNSRHIYLKNRRYISADFVAEYEINLEIHLVLQGIKSLIKDGYPYLLTLDDRLVTEFGGCFCKEKSHVSGSSVNKPRKPKRIIESPPDQSNDIGNYPSHRVEVADTIKEKKEDRPSLCRFVSPWGANAKGFISAQKATMESAFLEGYKETHKFACFSIAVSYDPNANPRYSFDSTKLDNVVNAMWAIDCNMYSDVVDIEPLVGGAHNCELTANPQMITVFILVPKDTPPEFSFAGAFQNDTQIMRFYGLVPYANNLPGMQELAEEPEDSGWHMEIIDAQGMFLGATKLTRVEMVMDHAQNTSQMFANAPVFSGKSDVTYDLGLNSNETSDTSNIDMWDTGNITNMESMFSNARNFNGDISRWDTSNATNMESMFMFATNFNQDISGWNTESVETMASMFSKATHFTGDISKWSTGSVKTMEFMFSHNTEFNGDISDWNTSNVTNMNSMFFHATNFNGDIGGWNTGRVETMEAMFFEAKSFKGNLTDWNTGNVTNMSFMFSMATSFNGDISGWNTGNVTNMASMFWWATSFNRDMRGWDTGNVTNMAFMFSKAIQFDGDVSGWNTINVTDMSSMFSEAKNFNRDISRWETENVANMEFMFFDAENFNKDISRWKTGSVTNMRSMFHGATHFNRDLSRWNVRQVAEHGHFSDGSALAVRYLPNNF